MAAAASLTQAAEQSWDNLAPFSNAGTLRTRILAFCTTGIALYPQSLTLGHPVANWLAVLQALGTTMASTVGEWPLLRLAADYVYRLCFMAEQFLGSLPTQSTALLAAYNANF